MRVQTEPIDAGAELSHFLAGLDGARAGGVASFTGVVRDVTGGAHVAALELEHYPGLTEPVISSFVDQACARFGLVGAHVIHRVGRMTPSEAIVFVAAAAAHRRAAFQGAEFLMDYLKSRAPLWKREFGPDGARWIEPRDDDHRARHDWEAG